MTATIISNNDSNVIYLQDAFHFPEYPFPDTILQLPFAKVALHFPWEAVFSSYEQEFLQARLEHHKKNPAEREEELQEHVLFDLPSPSPVSGSERAERDEILSSAKSFFIGSASSY
ncbi:hypothetical protein [Peribacillus cavernae]|uniref:hypothetical protein n=1 Tax=Peribacillus cavernae TaxID=1674310 RepID=UPI00163CA469|nr:hypothetical protein [Peribacillus cavernae]MDQ0218043.1 hypothetical protein [Peribacillus cavernae]